METTPKNGYNEAGNGTGHRLSFRGSTPRRKINSIPRSPFVRRAVQEQELRRQSNRRRSSYLFNSIRHDENFGTQIQSQDLQNGGEEDVISNVNSSQFNYLKLLSRTLVKERKTIEARLSNNEVEIKRLKDAHSSFVESMSKSARSSFDQNSDLSLLEGEQKTKRERTNIIEKNYKKNDHNEYEAESSSEDEEQTLPQPMNLTQILLESAKSGSSETSTRSSERSNLYRRSIMSDYKDPFMEKEINRITTNIENNHSIFKRARKSNASSISSSSSMRQSISSAESLRKQLDSLLNLDMQKRMQNIENQYEYMKLQRRSSSFVDIGAHNIRDDQVRMYDHMENELPKEPTGTAEVIIHDDSSGSSTDDDDDIIILDRSSMMMVSGSDAHKTDKHGSSIMPLSSTDTDEDMNNIGGSSNKVDNSMSQIVSDGFNIVDQSDILANNSNYKSEVSETDDSQEEEDIGEEHDKEVLAQDIFEVAEAEKDMETNIAAASSDYIQESEIANSTDLTGINDYDNGLQMLDASRFSSQNEENGQEESLEQESASRTNIKSSTEQEGKDEDPKHVSQEESTKNDNDTHLSFEVGRDTLHEKITEENEYMDEMEMTGIIAPEDLVDYDTSLLSKNNEFDIGLDEVISEEDSDEGADGFDHQMDGKVQAGSMEDILIDDLLLYADDNLTNENANKSIKGLDSSEGRFPKRFIKSLSEFYLSQPLFAPDQVETSFFDSNELKLFSKLSINSILKNDYKKAKLNDHVLRSIEEISNTFLENQISDLMDFAGFGKRRTIRAKDMLLLIKRSRYFKDLKKDGKLVDGNIFNYVFSQASELFSIEELNEIQNDCTK